MGIHLSPKEEQALRAIVDGYDNRDEDALAGCKGPA